MRRALALVAVLLCLADRAEAQQCTGGPSFRDAPTQAGLAASFVGERHEIGGTFGFGRPSLFGGIGVSATHLSFVGTAPTFSAVIGTEIASADHPVFTCPLFQASYSTGPDDDPFDVSSFGFRTGVSVGAVVVQQNAMAVIPTFSIMLLYDRANVSYQNVNVTTSGWSGVATFGAGFLFTRNLSVIPALEIPFSSGAADAGFSFRWVYGFGR